MKYLLKFIPVHIGETSRTIRIRINEHTIQKFSEVHKHFIEKHKRSPKLELIKLDIMGRVYISATYTES